MQGGRTVLVTGVSGQVAGPMARRLRAGGLRVRALVRTSEQAAVAAEHGWESAHGELGRPESLRSAVRGVDVVVHAAAYLGQDWELAETANSDGTRWLAQASLDAGVSRFVQVSTMSVHGDPQPDGLDEDSPLALADTRSAYVATKARAELALAEVRARGLAAVILRPGAICSARNSKWGDILITRLRDPDWRDRWHPDDVIPWVHTDDLAEMTWLAATHPAAVGQTFLAVDANIAIRDYFIPIMTAMRLQGITPPDRAPFLSRCRIGKIRTVLGYRPQRTFEQTLEELTELAAAVPATAPAQR